MECRGAAWLVIGHLSSKRYDQHISAYAYVSRNVKYQTTSNDRLNRVDRMRDSIPGGPVAFAHSQTYTALTKECGNEQSTLAFWLAPPTCRISDNDHAGAGAVYAGGAAGNGGNHPERHHC